MVTGCLFFFSFLCCLHSSAKCLQTTEPGGECLTQLVRGLACCDASLTPQCGKGFFSLSVSFQRRLSCGVCTATRAQSHKLNPKHWRPHHCLECMEIEHIPRQPCEDAMRLPKGQGYWKWSPTQFVSASVP